MNQCSRYCDIFIFCQSRQDLGNKRVRPKAAEILLLDETKLAKRVHSREIT